jgi:hypothetical protein
LFSLGLVACSGPVDKEVSVDPSGETCTVGLDPMDCPPDFTLDAVGGGSVTLSELVGQRVVIIGTSNW